MKQPAARWTRPTVLSVEEFLAKYCGTSVEELNREETYDWRTAIVDVLADLMHVADKHDVEWESALWSATNHHDAERSMKCTKCGLLIDESEPYCVGCESEDIEVFVE